MIRARLPHMLLVLLALALFVLSLGLGPVRLSPGEVAAALFAGPEETNRIIVAEIRLPRAILAASIGAMLGLAGAALQGLTRNPLADPSLFGAPQSAAFAAVALVSFGGADILSFAVPVAAILGAFASVFLLLAIAGRDAPMMIVILSGLAVSSLAGAATALAMNLAPNFYAALEIAFWLLGSLEDRGFRHVALALPFMLAGAALLLSQRASLRALTAGEEVAESLGVAVARVRLTTIAGVALGVGAAVAVSGAIGFIGLVAPHLTRRFVGHDPGRSLGVSALAGAALLLAADALVRLAPATSDLKVGVVTALVGAPFFLALIARERRTLAGDAA
jgi:iron complex transport system permease protein